MKLLRVLEEREFQRVGDNKNIKVDIRLITATNKDLYKKVLEGTFRDDLYYRISVFPLHLPALRERVEDIPLLIDHFIKKFNKQMGKSVQGIANRVLEILEAYAWPGNIRELSNAVEHAFVHCKGTLIHPADLPQNIGNVATGAGVPPPPRAQEKLDLVERDLIVKALAAADGKKSVTARRLGISRATLWRKMEKYRING